MSNNISAQCNIYDFRKVLKRAIKFSLNNKILKKLKHSARYKNLIGAYIRIKENKFQVASSLAYVLAIFEIEGTGSADFNMYLNPETIRAILQTKGPGYIVFEKGQDKNIIKQIQKGSKQEIVTIIQDQENQYPNIDYLSPSTSEVIASLTQEQVLELTEKYRKSSEKIICETFSNIMFYLNPKYLVMILKEIDKEVNIKFNITDTLYRGPLIFTTETKYFLLMPSHVPERKV